MGGPLRPQLKENYHYVLIPQEVWDALVIWYGGGPTIARFVVQVGDPELGNVFNRVNVYPVRLYSRYCCLILQETDLLKEYFVYSRNNRKMTSQKLRLRQAAQKALQHRRRMKQRPRRMARKMTGLLGAS